MCPLSKQRSNKANLLNLYPGRRVIITKHNPFLTLEIHCTQTAQSSRCGCSRRVHKIVNPAVKKGHSFTLENFNRELLSLINPAMYLLNKLFGG